MRRRHSTSGPLLFALAASSALGATVACVLPGYDVTSSSGGDAGGGATTSTGGAGGSGGATTTPTDTTGGSGGAGATTSTGTTGGGGTGGIGGAGGTGGTGGTTTSTPTTSTVCMECPQWAIGFGSPDVDSPHAVAVDPAGAIVVGGEIHGTVSIPPEISLIHKGGADGFFARVTASGGVVSATSFPGDASGTNDQIVRDVVYTASGVIAAGDFVGTLAPPGGPPLINTAGAASTTTDGFVVKYNLDGTHAWSVQLGGSGDDSVRHITLDTEGNIVVAGTYTGTPTIGGTALGNFGGFANGFVLKLDPGGAFLPAATFPVRSWGSPDPDAVTGLAVSPSNEVLVAGHHTKSLGFDDGTVPTLVNPSTTTPDGYLVRLDSTGDYTLAKPLGGIGNQRVFGLAASDVGAIFVAGIFDGTISFGNGSLVDAGGVADIFVARLDGTGASTWVVQGMDAGSAPPLGLALSKEGGPVIVGGFSGTTTLFGSTDVTSMDLDAFVVRLDPAGTLVKRHVFTHPDAQRASAVAVDGSGAIVVAGEIAGTVDFGVTIPVVSNGAADILLLRIEP